MFIVVKYGRWVSINSCAAMGYEKRHALSTGITDVLRERELKMPARHAVSVSYHHAAAINRQGALWLFNPTFR